MKLFESDYNDLICPDPHLPAAHRDDFVDVVRRVHTLIPGLTTESFAKPCDDLEGMLMQVAPEYFTDAFDDDELLESDAIESLPKRLYHCREAFRLDELGDLDWSAYFGLLALYLISRANVDNAIFGTASPARQDLADRPMLIAACASEALEAVRYGELLQAHSANDNDSDAPAEPPARDTISEHPCQSESTRFRENHRLKAEFITFYTENSYLTKSEAARQFYRRLPEARRIYPTEDLAVRTMTAALSEHPKSSA